MKLLLNRQADGLMDIYRHSVNEAAEGIDIDESCG